jgi:hypothetical protein
MILHQGRERGSREGKRTFQTWQKHNRDRTTPATFNSSGVQRPHVKPPGPVKGHTIIGLSGKVRKK